MRYITLQEIKDKISNKDYLFEDFKFDSTVKTSDSEFDPNKSTPAIYFGHLIENGYEELGNLRFKNCEFDLDVFFHSINYKEPKGEFYFLENVTFKNNVGFEHFESESGMKIKNVIFNKQVLITNIKVTSLSFLNVQFNSAFNFAKSHIGSCYFDDSKFIGESTFSSIFIDDFELNNVEFNNNCEFNDYTPYESIQFKGNSWFNCTFKKKCFFKSVYFNSVDFSKCNFGDDNIVFWECEFHSMGFFRNLNLNDKLLFEHCDLTHCSFLFSVIDKVLFVGCKFNFKKLFDETILKGKVKRQLHYLSYFGIHYTKTLYPTAHDILDTYRMFETNFDLHKDYEMAGEFHKRIHEVNKLANTEIRKKTHLKCKEVIKHPRIVRRYFKNIIIDFINGYCVPTIKNSIINLYKLFSNYGESYIRTLLIFLFILFITAFLYMFTGLKYNDTHNNRNHIINYLSVSDTTKFSFLNDFGVGLTFSLNNSIPIKKSFENTQSATETTSAISYFETIIQTILITLFIIAIRRKFKR